MSDLEAPIESGGKKYKHERSTPLPTRIRNGQMEDEHLVLEGQAVLWGDVEHISLGIIDQVVKAAESPKGTMRKMMGKVMGKEDESKGADKGKQVREVYLLDLFVAGQPQPFRLESGNLNYRQFLDEVGYVSLHNFFKFCVHLARRSKEATFDDSMVAFLQRRREQVAHYNAIYDFEMEVQQMRANPDRLTPHEELDLSRDSWVDEWDDW